MTDEANSAATMIDNSAATELSANRTALAFERTALAMDRTLMASIRTSLALIGFGFTIFQFFHTLNTKFLTNPLPAQAPRRFGLALIVLGVILLAIGIFNHWQEAQARRARRRRLYDLNLIHHFEPLKVNSSMVVAILLLAVGLLAILSVAARVGPF